MQDGPLYGIGIPPQTGAFMYAVRTTKIFCRPVCKARLARRANVVFYSSALEAQKAGFRPCKRCKPVSVRLDAGGRGNQEDPVMDIAEGGREPAHVIPSGGFYKHGIRDMEA